MSSPNHARPTKSDSDSILPSDAVGNRLRREQQRILELWQRRVRSELPAARSQSELALTDSLPCFLAKLSAALSDDKLRKKTEQTLEATAEEHGQSRAALSDYSLQQVLLEFRILRDVIFAVLESEEPLSLTKRDIIFNAFEVAMSATAAEFYRLKIFHEQVEQFKAETYARNLRDLQAVTEAAIARSTDFHNLLIALVQEIKAIFRCDSVSIYVTDENDRDMILSASDGLEEDARRELRIPAGKGVPGAILRQEKGPLVIEDFPAVDFEILSPALRASRIRSLVGVKLLEHGRLVGAMTIATLKPRRFEAAELRFLELIADRIAVAISNARIYRKAQEELSQFKADDALRARLLSILAHDIRNPLAVAQMSAELLVRKKGNPELVRDLSGKVSQSIRRADRLVKDLLDVNRTLSGRRLELLLEPSDLHEIISAAISTLTPQHGDRFIYRHPDAPLSGNWAPGRLQRAFEKLLAVSLGWIREETPVVISEKAGRGTVEIAIHAAETCLTREKAASVSETLKLRAKPSESSPSEDGTLALILAEGIIKAHGGEISLLCEQETGMTLTVRVPLDSGPFQTD